MLSALSNVTRYVTFQLEMMIWAQLCPYSFFLLRFYKINWFLTFGQISVINSDSNLFLLNFNDLHRFEHFFIKLHYFNQSHQFAFNIWVLVHFVIHLHCFGTCIPLTIHSPPLTSAPTSAHLRSPPLLPPKTFTPQPCSNGDLFVANLGRSGHFCHNLHKSNLFKNCELWSIWHFLSHSDIFDIIMFLTKFNKLHIF